MLIGLLCIYKMTIYFGKILLWNSKRLLRKLQKILRVSFCASPCTYGCNRGIQSPHIALTICLYWLGATCNTTQWTHTHTHIERERESESDSEHESYCNVRSRTSASLPSDAEVTDRSLVTPHGMTASAIVNPSSSSVLSLAHFISVSVFVLLLIQWPLTPSSLRRRRSSDAPTASSRTMGEASDR